MLVFRVVVVVVVAVLVVDSVMTIGGLGVLESTGVPSEDKLDYTRFLANNNFSFNFKGLNISFIICNSCKGSSIKDFTKIGNTGDAT